MTRARIKDEEREELLIAIEATGLTREQLVKRLGLTSRALRFYLAGERRVPRLVRNEIVRWSKARFCMCHYLPKPQYEVCPWCKSRGKQPANPGPPGPVAPSRFG